ncbi:hypothetical protein ERJ75_000247900 [Trypanosoma vivax]|nr:hypothetical protein ERJ75_000247900 [Trypanosoma vivax]
MFCRSFIRFLTLAEGKSLFLDAAGAKLSCSTASLTQTLQVLSEHHNSGTRALTHAALERLLHLDATDNDTAAIAMFSPTEHAASNGTCMGARCSSVPASQHFIVQLMLSHSNDPTVCEGCCRCIANMCRLSATHTSCNAPIASPCLNGTHDVMQTDDQHSHDGDNHMSVADALVNQGAVELALDTLRMSDRLSERGRAWAALAVLNLLCLSKGEEATRRAAESNGERILTKTLRDVMTHASGHGRLGIFNENGGVSDHRCGEDEQVHSERVDGNLFTSVRWTSMDAGLGAIARLLIAAAEDNATGVRYRYEQVEYEMVKVVVQSIAFLSQLVVHSLHSAAAMADQASSSETVPAAGHLSGGGMYSSVCLNYSACHVGGGSAHRKTFCFQSATHYQQTAVQTLLPPLHKAWTSLRYLSKCSGNLPMLYEALSECSRTTFGGGDVSRVSVDEPIGMACGLQTILEAVLLLGAEMRGLADAGNDAEAQLQEDMLLHAVGTLVELISVRKDLDQRQLAQVAAVTTSSARKSDGESTPHDGDKLVHNSAPEGGHVELSAVIPTEAALGVMEMLSSGLTTRIALTTLMRIRAKNVERAGQPSVDVSSNDQTLLKEKVCAVTQWSDNRLYDTSDFELVSYCIQALVNLGEQDIAVASPNTLAVLDTLLADATLLLGAIVKGRCASLESAESSKVCENPRLLPAFKHVSLSDGTVMFQQAALAAQIYAVLWGVLRRSEGVHAIRQLKLWDRVKGLQKILDSMCVAAEDGAQAPARETASAISSTPPLHGVVHEAGKTSGTSSNVFFASAAEETICRLLPLGRRVLHSLELVGAEGAGQDQ